MFGKFYHISGHKNSSRFAIGKLVTSIRIKETEEDTDPRKRNETLQCKAPPKLYYYTCCCH
ncbi:hypothetical protein Avbf_18980 [Armadillidium vulgare]|nr:hypothetical protein Avbf_18980 [Armadillidium vulgare]